MKSIYRCNEINNARQKTSHVCHKIASAQMIPICSNYQVPEPWRGDLKNVPLLFISSNPSLDSTDDSPWATDDNLTIETYFNNGFDTEIFPKINHPGSNRKTRVAFWASILNRASELFGLDKRKLTPGRDFAITEVVHCKSRSEFCVQKHLPLVLNKNNAVVICLLGEVARKAFNNYKSSKNSIISKAIIVSLPHPNARKPRSVGKALTNESLSKINNEDLRKINKVLQDEKHRKDKF